MCTGLVYIGTDGWTDGYGRVDGRVDGCACMYGRVDGRVRTGGRTGTDGWTDGCACMYGRVDGCVYGRPCVRVHASLCSRACMCVHVYAHIRIFSRYYLVIY